MEPDFSGYATKAGLKCTDGRTIMPNAFEKQHGVKVPLVWQHAHDESSNVLGHALLENREDGVYAYGFFNETQSGQNAKALVQHGDITFLSIYANQLVERTKNVIHGAIREVSLVLAGANPGAFIESVSMQHSDGEIVELPDEAIIHTGLALEHVDGEDDDEETLEHAKGEVPPQFLKKGAAKDDSGDGDGESVEDIYNSMSEKQKKVLHYMIGVAMGEKEGGSVAQSGLDNDGALEHAVGPDATVKDVYDSMNEDQQNVLHFMVAEALESAGTTAEHSDTNNDETTLVHKEGTDMSRNVFDQNATKADGPTLSHDQLEQIITDAQKPGSTFKESFLAHAAEYGIENIDILFPDAQTVTSSPEWISRRMEWVGDVIAGTKHSPFSRIKSTAADLTADQARAKGYVKGNKKKDEVIKLLKRVTTPTTIYKKQKLDRDDIVDITNLDVVVWLKAEMRLMLDEELARAVLIGDGRESDDEDKISEDHLRPIAYDDDMYSHKVTVPANIAPDGVVESVLRARSFYRGTGTPTMYTTDKILTDLMLDKDKVGRRLYETEAALAAAMRVSKIVTVEVMEDTPDIMAIIVNLADYTMGADQGGNISMFDDFDIDYNQYKYLIETRVSGALTKPKSAVIVRRVVGTSVTPETPSYNGQTHTITIPDQDGVTYRVEGVAKPAGPVVINETSEVEASADQGYSFPANTVTNWTYVYTA